MTIKGQTVPRWVLWATALNIIITGIVSSLSVSFTIGGKWQQFQEFAQHGQQAWEYLFLDQKGTHSRN